MINWVTGMIFLKMASAQVVETSVANNSPSQDSNHPDDHFQLSYVTAGFKLVSYSQLSLQSSCLQPDRHVNGLANEGTDKTTNENTLNMEDISKSAKEKGRKKHK